MESCGCGCGCGYGDGIIFSGRWVSRLMYLSARHEQINSSNNGLSPSSVPEDGLNEKGVDEGCDLAEGG